MNEAWLARRRRRTYPTNSARTSGRATSTGACTSARSGALYRSPRGGRRPRRPLVSFPSWPRSWPCLSARRASWVRRRSCVFAQVALKPALERPAAAFSPCAQQQCTKNSCRRSTAVGYFNLCGQEPAAKVWEATAKTGFAIRIVCLHRVQKSCCLPVKHVWSHALTFPVNPHGSKKIHAGAEPKGLPFARHSCKGVAWARSATSPSPAEDA